MCGISGVWGDGDPGLIREISGALRHRGPDGSGYHHDGLLHLGAQRLSIIDVEQGGQPVYNEDRSCCLVFNGEIYNYRELQSELRSRGHTLRSESDTEVIVHLYEEFGERCVEHLRGMFAFAISDGDRLLLARDRLGIKPLYYALLPEVPLLLFASEIKALLRAPALTPNLDMQALADSVILNYPVEGQTYFAGVQALEPGQTMTVSLEQGRIEPRRRRYYQVALEPDETMTFVEAKRELIDRLRSTVASHLMADVGAGVEVGLTLSGGVDSSLLAMLMAEEYDRPITAFTIADQAEHPDLAQARIVAGEIDCRHEVTLLSFEDYLAAIPACIWTEEQPSSLAALPFFELCRRVGRRLKVCLNGEGADELFGGYPEYADRYYRTGYMRRRLPALQQLGLPPSPRVVEVIGRLSTTLPFEEYLQGIFAVNLGDQLVRQHLDIVDKYAMAAGVECRVPYMDHELVEFVNGLPLHFKVNWQLGIQKHILRRVLTDRYGERLVDIALRRKLGFPSAGVSHLARFNQLCEELLPADYLERHELGCCFASKRELLLFELFQEIFMVRRGAKPEGLDVREFIQEQAARAGSSAEPIPINR